MAELQHPFTCGELAQRTGGRLIGPAGRQIHRLVPLDAPDPQGLAFLREAKQPNSLNEANFGLVLVPQDFPLETAAQDLALLLVADPNRAFNELLKEAVAAQPHPQGIESPVWVAEGVSTQAVAYLGAFSRIGEGTELGAGVRIYDHVSIGRNVRIGEHAILYPGVVVMDDSVIGDRCVLHPGCVIGGEGFGYLPDEDGVFEKIPQTGRVVLEDDVEIGANTTIDRATLGETRIGKGVKIDNLVMIAHNVRVGPHSVMAAQTGISGSTQIGSHCMFGGQTGIAGHISIADGTQLGAKAGVSQPIREPGQVMRGQPVQPIRKQMRSELSFQQLPDVLKRLRQLEGEVEKLRREASAP